MFWPLMNGPFSLFSTARLAEHEFDALGAIQIRYRVANYGESVSIVLSIVVSDT